MEAIKTTISPANVHNPIPFKILLVAAYSILFIYVTAQMVLTLRGKNKKLSFNFGFLLICIIWVGVRLAYFIQFLVYDPHPSPIWSLADTAAVDIQFAACTFLMLFYVRMILRMRWQQWRRRLAFVVFIINAIFDVFSVSVFVIQQLFTTPFPKTPSPRPPDFDFWNNDDNSPSPQPTWEVNDYEGTVPSPAPKDDEFADVLADVYVSHGARLSYCLLSCLTTF